MWEWGGCGGGGAQCSVPSNPDILGPFSAPSLTVPLGVALLHFETLLAVGGAQKSTFQHETTRNVQGRTWSAFSQLVHPATDLLLPLALRSVILWADGKVCFIPELCRFSELCSMT